MIRVVLGLDRGFPDAVDHVHVVHVVHVLCTCMYRPYSWAVYICMYVHYRYMLCTSCSSPSLWANYCIGIDRDQDGLSIHEIINRYLSWVGTPTRSRDIGTI